MFIQLCSANMSYLRYLQSLLLGETNRNRLKHATGVKRLRKAARQALLKISMCEAVDRMITLTIWKYSVTSFVNGMFFHAGHTT